MQDKIGHMITASIQAIELIIKHHGKISNPGVPQKPLRDIRQAHHYGFGIVNDSIELHAISL
jgi:hypothetical protein